MAGETRSYKNILRTRSNSKTNAASDGCSKPVEDNYSSVAGTLDKTKGKKRMTTEARKVESATAGPSINADSNGSSSQRKPNVMQTRNRKAAEADSQQKQQSAGSATAGPSRRCNTNAATNKPTLNVRKSKKMKTEERQEESAIAGPSMNAASNGSSSQRKPNGMQSRKRKAAEDSSQQKQQSAESAIAGPSKKCKTNAATNKPTLNVRKSNRRKATENDEPDQSAVAGPSNCDNTDEPKETDVSSNDTVAKGKRRKYVRKAKKVEPSTESSKETENRLSNECQICMSPITTNEIGSPSGCEHTFCFRCLLKWSEINNTCPIDRNTFNSIEVRSSIGGTVTREVPVKAKRVPEANFTLLAGWSVELSLSDSEDEDFENAEGDDGDSDDESIFAIPGTDNEFDTDFDDDSSADTDLEEHYWMGNRSINFFLRYGEDFSDEEQNDEFNVLW